MAKSPEMTRNPLPVAQMISYETVQLNQKGEIIASLHGEARLAVDDLGAGAALELVAVPAGVFQMGSHHEGGYPDETPLHPVYLSGFWLGRTPVTQAQWLAVMDRLPACRFHGSDLPVDTISWRDARRFCQRLSRRTGRLYSLPSEAQWEYACRAGTATPFSFGETITTDVANFVGGHTYREAPPGVYRHTTTPPGTFPPNPWGFFDMHGNVWEFCQDVWTDDYTGAPVDGSAHQSRPLTGAAAVQDFITSLNWKHADPSDLTYRVARGGSWHETPTHCRSAMRLKVAEFDRMEYYGLRVMLPITPGDIIPPAAPPPATSGR